MSEFIAGLILGAIIGFVLAFLAGWLFPLHAAIRSSHPVR